MKVMGIVAGRHNGNSEILVKQALTAVKNAGGEAILINLFDYDIKPCSGCESCTIGMEKAFKEKKEYKGCIYKEKDDMDKIVNVMNECEGIIVGCPTYDLLPSSLYLSFAQRFLAYELSFRIKIGQVKKDPHTVAGLIGVGGSKHDWQTMSLEGLAATMFTQSITVVDMYLATSVGRPGNVLIHKDYLERAYKIGKNIVQAINTPVEERKWLGDPNLGLCPRCHSSLIYPGEEHWDGVKFNFECAVCGAGGDLVKGENGKYKFVLAENGLIRDRNIKEARAVHLQEIMETRDNFMSRKGEIEEEYKRFREMKFETIK